MSQLPPDSISPSAEAVPQWMLDLDRVGFARRIFMARKWYGGDWWFVVFSALLDRKSVV